MHFQVCNSDFPVPATRIRLLLPLRQPESNERRLPHVLRRCSHDFWAGSLVCQVEGQGVEDEQGICKESRFDGRPRKCTVLAGVGSQYFLEKFKECLGVFW